MLPKSWTRPFQQSLRRAGKGEEEVDTGEIRRPNETDTVRVNLIHSCAQDRLIASWVASEISNLCPEPRKCEIICTCTHLIVFPLPLLPIPLTLHRGIILFRSDGLRNCDSL